jgi:hypothetical protein
MKGAQTVFAVLSGVSLLEKQTPQTYREAMAGPEKSKWRAAAEAEFAGCEAQNTWKLVDRATLPKATNIIPVKWVFKIKTDENGAVAKYKARITPKGFKQRHGVDYFEVYASTGKYKTLRVVLSLAARRDMELRQLDVPQAFTQAGLDEDVYMEMPEGFEVAGKVCHLLKSLYGLKQSPRNWWLLVSTFIISDMGWQATVSDPCLFQKKSRSGQLMLLFLFVDDMQVAFDKADEAEWAECHEMLRRRFNITDLGESKFMLGMRITRDRRLKSIKLDQELYITKALEKFGLDRCKTASTPGVQLASGSSSSRLREGDRVDESTVISKADELIDIKAYQEKVGTLLYAAISTRPDVAYAVNKLAQNMLAPTATAGKACDQVFRYLAGTKDLGLQFGCRRSPAASAQCAAVATRLDGTASGDLEEMTITAYADADWGSDPTDRKSITGWVAMLNGDSVSWASKKQKVVAQSSCEAELYAEAAAINEIKWLHGLLQELGVSVREPPTLFGDNQSTQELSKNGVKSERTKHIDIKYHFVTDEVSKGKVKLQWVSTKEQLADVLTKALPQVVHEKLCTELMC